MNSARTTWPLRTVALAASMKPRALRQWLDTKVITLQGNDRKSTGHGDHCGLSRQRAYQAAIVQHLNKLGMSVSRAATAAFEFSDRGNLSRQAGKLFEHGKTYLCISAGGSVVKNASYDVTLADVSDRDIALIAIDLNKIVQQVDDILKNESVK